MDKKDRVYVGIYRELHGQIREFCDFNGIKLTEYVNTLLKDAFMRDKYGERPFFTSQNSEENEPELENRQEVEENAEILKESPKNTVIVEIETETNPEMEKNTEEEPQKEKILPTNTKTTKRTIKVK